DAGMAPLCYRRHRFPPEIIQHAIWLYLRFTLSYRDVEELLAERGLDISYETVRPLGGGRRDCARGMDYALRVARRRLRLAQSRAPERRRRCPQRCNPWLGAIARCSRTGSSNPSPSSGESSEIRLGSTEY